MPDTPIEEARVAPEVAPSAGLPMAVTAQAMGEGIGQGLQQLGEVAYEVHRRERTYADRAAVLDADNQTNGFLNDRLYNAQTGLLHQSPGKDAPEAVDQTLSDFDAHVSKVSASLTDDRQRLAYQRMAKNRRMDLDRQLGTFEHQETTRYADEVDSSAIAQTSSHAVHNANNPELIGKDLGHIEEVIAAQGERKGLAPEAIKERQAEAVSATHMGVLEQLLVSGRDQAAQSWFDANKSDLTAKDLTVATARVQAGSLAGDATRKADQIVTGEGGALVDRATALDRIEKDPQLQANPKLRVETETRAMHVIDLHNEAKREQDGATVDEAWKLLKDPGNAQGAYNPKYIQLKAGLPPERQQQLENAERREIPEFSREEYDLERLVGTPAFVHADLTSYVGKVQGAKLAHFAELQREQAEKGSTGPKVALAETQTRIVDNALGNLGFTEADGDKGRNSDSALQFRNRFDDMQAAAVAENGGKPVSREDLEAIAKKLTGDYAIQTERARFSPLRIFGPTFADSKGALFRQPADVVALNTPLPGTERATTGEPMTRAGVNAWVNVLSNPSAPGHQAALDQLRRTRQGLADDGTFDPAIVRRYQYIADAYAAAQTKP